jgi:hypothetical protein
MNESIFTSLHLYKWTTSYSTTKVYKYWTIRLYLLGKWLVIEHITIYGETTWYCKKVDNILDKRQPKFGTQIETSKNWANQIKFTEVCNFSPTHMWNKYLRWMSIFQDDMVCWMDLSLRFGLNLYIITILL